MIVASSDKEWLQWPIEILVLETVLSHLKRIKDVLIPGKKSSPEINSSQDELQKMCEW